MMILRNINYVKLISKSKKFRSRKLKREKKERSMKKLVKMANSELKG